MSRARSVIAGVLLANAVPHGVHGITGREFPTPFADPPGIGLSSPALNVLWSALNLVGAGVALRGIRVRPVALVVGAAAMASFLTAYFGPPSTRRRG